jgi:hypothetical protein
MEASLRDMHTSMAVFAERATQRGDGKLDVIGIHNCRYVAEVPTKIDLTLALRFELDPLDYGAPQVIAVHILDADETELASVRTNTVTFDAPAEPGLPRAYDLVVPLSVQLNPGTWIFDVRVNDRSVARAPMQILVVAAPA